MLGLVIRGIVVVATISLGLGATVSYIDNKIDNEINIAVRKGIFLAHNEIESYAFNFLRKVSRKWIVEISIKTIILLIPIIAALIIPSVKPTSILIICILYLLFFLLLVFRWFFNIVKHRNMIISFIAEHNWSFQRAISHGIYQRVFDEVWSQAYKKAKEMPWYAEFFSTYTPSNIARKCANRIATQCSMIKVVDLLKSSLIKLFFISMSVVAYYTTYWLIVFPFISEGRNIETYTNKLLMPLSYSLELIINNI